MNTVLTGLIVGLFVVLIVGYILLIRSWLDED